MKDVLISIKPKFVEKIMTGEKSFEFRKRGFSSSVRHIIIYSSSPQKRIIGYFTYSGIVKGNPKEVWEICKDKSGIDEKYYTEYYRDKEEAYAIKINEFIKFKKEINPKEIWPGFTAPQSFYYLKEDEFNEIFSSLV